MPFEAWARGWWKPSHEFIQRHIARGYPLSPSYMEECRRNLDKRILPHFGAGTVFTVKLPAAGA